MIAKATFVLQLYDIHRFCAGHIAEKHTNIANRYPTQSQTSDSWTDT